MILSKTSTWGSTWKCKRTTPNNYDKLLFKQSMNRSNPAIDHAEVYALKNRGQKGPARENQTLLLSFTYNYDRWFDDTEFINRVRAHGLNFYKEPVMFRGKDAYKIIIYDTDVDLNVALPLINELHPINLGMFWTIWV